MPLYRKRPYPKASPPTPEELAATSSATDLHKASVFVIPFTGEIFKTYPEYTVRYSFYMQKVWQCETTATKGLTYPQALESERRAAKILDGRFPEALKAQTLQLVSFSTSPLAELVEDMYNTFALNYQPGELVGCQIDGFVYSAKCIGRLRTAVSKDDPGAGCSEDPRNTSYVVQLLDANNRPAEEMTREVGVESLSRDRTQFSRVILRNFVRSAATKDPKYGSPWIVKPHIAKRYGISTIVPEHLRHLVDGQQKIKKRKQHNDDRSLSISQRISPPVRKKTAAEAEVSEHQRRKESSVRVRPKAAKYPIEDLDLRQARAGNSMVADEIQHADDCRPVLHRDFLVPSAIAGRLLTVWSFLATFGTPLGLYPFSVDDFECSLLHTTSVPRCGLMIEVVACLLNAIIADRMYMAPDSPGVIESPPGGISAALIHERFEGRKDDPELVAWQRAEMLGRGWDTRLLGAPNRERWGSALLGCIVDFLLIGGTLTVDGLEAAVLKLAQFREPGNPTPTRSSQEGQLSTSVVEDTFWALSAECKLILLTFLVNLVVGSSAVRNHMDDSVEATANIRREVAELKREAKRVQLARAEYDKNQAEEQTNARKLPEGSQKDNFKDEAVAVEYIEGQACDNLSRHEKLKRMAEHRRLEAERRAREVAVERRAANAARARAAERRKFDDDEARLIRQIQQKSQEELRYAVHRLVPLGRDRHHARYWYFDGFGALVGCAGGGPPPYAGGRLFVQEPAPCEESVEAFDVVRPSPTAKSSASQATPSWGFYSEQEELQALHVWLNPKGERELALRNALEAQMPSISNSMARRKQYLLGKELVSSRPTRVTRYGGGTASSAEPYLNYTNKLGK